jgi:alanyl-tRNA synthetase
MKELAKPEFALNPELYYPTTVFSRYGFSRAQCPKCGANFWRHTEAKETCGDSNCSGSYTFIGSSSRGTKITYAEAWEGFRRSLTSARVPCTAIDRYPVVARWRNDVPYVAAGIYCFQPYCVTGEMEPPANPLICPQFCVRFNDLDNIGLTGRHYSGFVMLGIQVFNLPDKFIFFKEECVDFNLRWLIEELHIAPDDITLVEDVWAGGGNLGPSVEYFVDGLELGNMVFMQYKTFPDGSREELPVKIIDVGIGLERIPWLVNGTATSYMDVFHHAFQWLQSKLNVPVNSDVWERFGPLSCRLNVDESEDIEATWAKIAELIGMSAADVKAAIAPVQDLYILLDHTRTLLMIIEDGSLPSNVGGGSNVRNILRRVFSILHKREWFELLQMEGLIELFQQHKVDLAALYGEFKEYKSFRQIIEGEYERWLHTDKEQREKLEKLIKKKKGNLELKDWILCVTSWGISPDKIAEISGLPVPGNLYYKIIEMQERITKAPEAILYSTTHLPATESTYFSDHTLYEFQATVIEVFQNLTQGGALNIVILDRSAFYPTSGGQLNDTGSLEIEGRTYQVVNAEKVGHCVLHILSEPVDPLVVKNKPAVGRIDVDRRRQLRNHHTATHIIFAACRKVLGPHIWQNGAKKTTESAHLDITHYRGLTHAEEMAIENEANRIVSNCVPIRKFFMHKPDAEKAYGFSLYQGGIVPSSQVRIVNIGDVDTEACCGTHCDNTAEVGRVRMLKSHRISDGIVRLYYVAGERAIERLNYEDSVLSYLSSSWNIPISDINMTADRFFSGYKKFENKVKKQQQQILDLTVRCLASEPQLVNGLVHSDQPDPTIYFSFMPAYASSLKQNGKNIVFVSSSFVYALLGRPEVLSQSDLEQFITPKEEGQPLSFRTKTKVQFSKGKKKEVVDGILEIATNGVVNLPHLTEFLASKGFAEFSN